jgi:hypothetical protein
MPFRSAPFPANDPVINLRTGKVLKVFMDWVSALVEDVDASPARLAPVELTQQGAAIGTTAVPTGVLSAGLYRVSWRARITRPATTSSSLTVRIHTTESAVSVSESGAAITGNAVGTVASGSMLVRIDHATPISYSTTYASVGATSMQYRLDVVVEQVYA